MKYAISFAAASALAVTAAFAGDPGGSSEGGMSGCMMKMDAKVEAHFKEVDANADGKVTEKELVKYMTAKAKKEFAEMSGGDGEATLDEANAYHQAKHEAMMKDMMGHGETDAAEQKPEDHKEHSEH
jgi:hypothetical protein